ncbi:MAG: outer membrane protein [Xanthobacteraceae bacterium]
MRHLIGITAAVALSGSAMAADLAVKAPGVGVGNWTSCYIGGNVAGGWSRNGTNDFVTTGPLAAGGPLGNIQIDGGGLNYGGQLGCDYQFSGRWVIGVEGKLDAGAITGNNTWNAPFLSNFGGTNMPYVGTGVVRLGYATDDRTMIYVNGGAGFSKDELTITNFGPAIFTATDNRVGYTVGVGLEHKWWPNVTGFIDYSYIELGKQSVTFSPAAGGAAVGSYGFASQVQQFMIGLNFRLYGGGPVHAAY